jgi:predicted ribosome quality control (RQC) complex YloA/Tae2 family protein
MQKARAKVAGLQQQLAAAGRADEIREQADLMLAYAHSVPRGALRMSVPDPQREGAERTFELDPARPVVVQAQALYERARRLEEGAAMTARRLAEAEALAAALTPIAATLDAPADDATLATLRARLQELGAVQHSPRTPTRTRPPTEVVRGTDFRRFVSAEGYTILVGRNNEQNDQLTMRTANGNDLWLHVGGGRPGSHVVVRLPKGKTASLETLLDAGALAVHFSKARGEPRLDVIYTFRKHVRKPKGLPAGAVVPSQTKTLTVLHDEARLRRLLDSGGGEE